MGIRKYRMWLTIEPHNPSNYISLSNVYASSGRWDVVAELRTQMKDSGLKKLPGCSWISINSETRSFHAADKTHSLIYEMLDDLILMMKDTDVVRCQSDSEVAVNEVGPVDENLENSDIPGFGDGSFTSAPGVDTVCVFPKNSARIVPAGEETEILVGLKNEGPSLNVVAVKASIHLPFDHRFLVQNLTVQVFNNASVPFSAQATLPYIFLVSKFLQPGTFDLVGTIFYEVDQNQYQSTFYNGNVEVVEASGFLSIESVFLVILGAVLLILGGLWVYGQVQNLSKKTKKTASKVEMGTRSTDASMDEWLQGTAFAQSASNKSKKKN